MLEKMDTTLAPKIQPSERMGHGFCHLCGNPKELIFRKLFDSKTGKRGSRFACMTFGCVGNHICSDSQHGLSFLFFKCRKCGLSMLDS